MKFNKTTLAETKVTSIGPTYPDPEHPGCGCPRGTMEADIIIS